MKVAGSADYVRQATIGGRLVSNGSRMATGERNRETVMFRLADSGNPRALALFEEILLGR